MKNAMKSCIAVLALAGLTGIATAADLSSDAVYKAKCAMCHGANGEGKAALRTKPLKESAAKSEADLTKVIENGMPKTSMKGYKGQLTEAQIKSIVSEIKALK